MNAMKSAREFWLEKEVARLSRDRGMLKAVHGALVDAGCRMGEIGHCEADLVRELTQEARRLRALIVAWDAVPFGPGADEEGALRDEARAIRGETPAARWPR